MSESGGSTSSGRSERFQTAVTILIALVSTIIALVASRAAVSSGNATEAQHNGVLAKINLERVDGGTRVQIARNRRAFNAYRFNRNLYSLTFDYVGQAEANGSSPHGTRLRLEAAGQLEESNLAYQFIDSGYLLSDEAGEYVDFNETEYVNDQRQTAAIYQDIDYDDDFALAQSERTASLALNLSLLVWFLALMFLTWAQIARSALRWVWLAAGVLLALGLVVAYALSSALNLVGGA
jgi:hypothetical protein